MCDLLHFGMRECIERHGAEFFGDFERHGAEFFGDFERYGWLVQ